MKVVVLCGGSGSRLWPISRDLLPKQFCKLSGRESLFHKVISRNKTLAQDFQIIVNQDQVFYAQDQLKEEAPETPANFILEPVGRNTAPAVALAALNSNPDDILLVVPSDHLIENVEHYHQKVREAQQLAEQGFIVTFGIKPSRPETGYGYIQFSGHNVIKFKEKPNLETAQDFIKQGNYYWNSGMFCFQAKTFLQELQKLSPHIYEASVTANNNSCGFPLKRITREDMTSIPSDSIDYAVMEKTTLAKTIPTELEWSDIGSFDSLVEFAQSDEHFSHDSKNNFVRSESKKFVALIGVEDLTVVDTGDALLVLKRGHGQDVRKVYEHLKETKSDLHKVHLQAFRPWGSYTVLGEEALCKTKKIEVKPGQRLSLQKHEHRSEHWIVVGGKAKVTVNESVKTYLPGEYIFIPQRAVHRLENETTELVTIIEVQTGSYLGEDDIVRLQDDYKRL